MPDLPRTNEALLDDLHARGFLHDDRVRAALAAVPRAPIVPDAAQPLAAVDVPAPLVDATREATPCPSPRIVATLLEAAGLEPGDDVLVHGRGTAWVAALAAHLVEGGSVTAVEADAQLVGTARAAAEDPDTVHEASAPEANAPYDRIVGVDPGRSPGDLTRHLDEGGVLVCPVENAEGVDLVRAFNDGSGVAEMRLGATNVADQAEGLEGKAGHRLQVSQLFGTEALLRDAWTGASTGGTAIEIREAVAETIGRALAERGLRRQAPSQARTAEGAFHVAYVHQMTGEFGAAMEAYTASIEILETSEAYTFRGWTRSFVDDLEGAIEDCKRGIEADPAFGNAYNDVGAYLLELDRPGEAVGWLEEAAEAERYSSRHFPYLNLGRAHLQLGNRDEARQALETALELDPGNEAAERLLERLEGRR